MTNERPIPLFTFKEDEDGISHININLDAKTPLGRFLSPIAPVPVVHGELGSFASVMNFYHYVRTGKKEPSFKTMNPRLVMIKSKQYLESKPDDFDDMIRDINRQKIQNNLKANKAFICSILPFDYYFLITDKVTGLPVKVRPREADKFVIMFEVLRIELRKKYDDAQASIANICSGTS